MQSLLSITVISPNKVSVSFSTKKTVEKGLLSSWHVAVCHLLDSLKTFSYFDDLIISNYGMLWVEFLSQFARFLCRGVTFNQK